jgi:putative transposase
MPLWRLYYHIVFATNERQPVLTLPLRDDVARLMSQQCWDMGCLLHALHVQPEHVHLALSIPPGLTVATVVGKIKGSSSHALSAAGGVAPDFSWQTGYGVFSFGEKNLPNVVRYVHDQDRRHSSGALWPELERVVARGIDDGPNRPPKADTPP